MTVRSPGLKRLAEALAALPAETTEPPVGGRIGAVLALLSETGDGDLEIVYTRRRDDLAHHPGQLSFPGGRVDQGETVEQAALREASEEVGLRPETVQVMGHLPPFYIPPSRFWMQVVVAEWRAPHALAAAEDEVAEVLHVRLADLLDEARWRTVDLSSGGHTWAWQLDERHLLWGATAVATTALLWSLDPDWSGGVQPGDLPIGRSLRPWEERPDTAVPRGGPALLPSVPEVPAAAPAGPLNGAGRMTWQRLDAAGAVGAAVTSELLARRRDPRSSTVVVLVGPGGKGAAGAETARRLVADGVDVHVVTDRGLNRLPTLVGERLDGLDQRVSAFGGALPAGALFIDALVGGGLEGPLAGEPRDVVLALRHHVAPVVSLDLPTGLHPTDGLIGECVTADLTLALGQPCPGVFHSGLGPFVGDLYLADLEGGPLVRLVPGADRTRWAE